MSKQLSPYDLYDKWEQGIHDAHLVAQVAWQIFKAELASMDEQNFCDAIQIPEAIEDFLPDILQASRVCASAFQNPGKMTLQ